MNQLHLHGKQENNLSKEIGFRLYRFRTSQGISQDNMAQVIGVNRSQIHRYEQGLSKITLEKIEQIWRYYNVSPLLFVSDTSVHKSHVHLMYEDCPPIHLKPIIDAYKSIQHNTLRQEAIYIVQSLARASQKIESSRAPNAHQSHIVR